MTTYGEILQAALALPPADRTELAAVLWDSVDLEPSDGKRTPELSAAWREEIARRTAEIDAGTAKFVSWEEVKRRVRSVAVDG